MLLKSIWHFRGRIKIAYDICPTETLDALEGMLSGQSKTIATRDESSISFREPIPLLSGGNRWDAMAIFDRGSFLLIDDNKSAHKLLAFDLSCLPAFIFCLIPVAIGLAVSFNDREQGIFIAWAGFCWLYGMNQLLARIRIPALVRRTIARIGTTAG